MGTARGLRGSSPSRAPGVLARRRRPRAFPRVERARAEAVYDGCVAAVTCAWPRLVAPGRGARAGVAPDCKRIRWRKTMPTTRRPQIFRITLTAFALVAVAAPQAARAQDQSPLPTTEFSLGVGYANVTLEDSPVIDS